MWKKVNSELSCKDNGDPPKMDRSVYYTRVMFLTSSATPNIMYKCPPDNGDFNALRLGKTSRATSSPHPIYGANESIHAHIRYYYTRIKYYA